MRKTRALLTLFTVLLLSLSLSSSVFAFNDIQKDSGRSHIQNLQKLGLMNGDGHGNFKPKESITVSTAVTLIVKGLKLNIDNIRFIKAPQASDYFSKVKNDAPYASTFIIAQLNGLELPKTIDPAAKVTREQFAHWLFKGISATGDYVWPMMYVGIKDANKIDAAYSDSIQKLLIGKIATLDENQKFRPKDKITRSETAVMLDKAIAYVAKQQPTTPATPASVLTDVTLSAEAFGDGVKKVTLSAQAPHPGYGFEVSSITFSGQQAVVKYRVIAPDPNKMYAQVITTVKAVTYINSSYTPVLGAEEK